MDPGELLDEIEDGSFPRPGAGTDGAPDPDRTVVPTAPSTAVGLGAALAVAVGGCYLLLAAAAGVWTAMTAVLVAVFVVGLLAAAVDPFAPRA